MRTAHLQSAFKNVDHKYFELVKTFWRMYYMYVASSASGCNICMCVLAAQQSLGRGSQADKQSSDSSPDANDEQWLSQVCAPV